MKTQFNLPVEKMVEMLTGEEENLSLWYVVEDDYHDLAEDTIIYYVEEESIEGLVYDREKDLLRFDVGTDYFSYNDLPKYFLTFEEAEKYMEKLHEQGVIKFMFKHNIAGNYIGYNKSKKEIEAEYAAIHGESK